jgi:hypothetical protein
MDVHCRPDAGVVAPDVGPAMARSPASAQRPPCSRETGSGVPGLMVEVSHMQLDHITIGYWMLSADMLSVESALAPHARVLE